MGLRTACLSLTAVFLIVFVFISIISDDIQGIELKGDDEVKIKPERSKGKTKSNVKKRESGFMDDFGNDEIHVGGKRFKLFEKKHLNYKKATAYCKKNDGKLAEAMNLEEMRRLQLLLMKARSIGNDMWVGADKKEWKKHSLKMQRRPNFGPDPMLFGGGPTEMCPALSVSTRSLTPVSCSRDLPFICEFGPGGGKSGNKATKADPVSKGKGKSKAKSKVEMRRKREIVLSTLSIPNTKETTSANNEDEDTTEMYITESPAEAAAEHNIGFSPHVEHVQTEGLTTSGKPENVSSIPTDTSLKLVQDSTKATTTLDPDQMLIDLIDEQTVNLTAIELESMNASANLATQVFPSQLPSSQVAVSGDFKASQKIVEFIDSNDLTDNAVTASLDPEYANNSALVLSEELQQGNTTSNNSEYSFSTDSQDSTEPSSSTSSATFNLPNTSGTKPPTEETVDGNKRPMRNASYPHQVKVEGHNNPHEDNTTESEKPFTPSPAVEVDVVDSQETSMSQNYTHLHQTTTDASSLEGTHSVRGNTTASYSGSITRATSSSLFSSMMPVLESSNRSSSTVSENRTSYEELYLTTEADMTNDTLADME
ncbi:unnamed protein product [Allacma fusca]|uniref:C-type lectin domain-containing protein n=1 Tax=Allacma fusca TaxID=39272 RepID=A0A8J2LUI3_9HEXA|nr:unnamed protein product [Allacma fusca]